MKDATAQYYTKAATALVYEHNHLCSRYKLPLRDPIIDFVQSKEFLGQFCSHPKHPKIRLNTELLDSKPWDAIVQIFKHEVAHQIVDEVYNSKDSHGEVFQQACEKIFVHPAFRNASASSYDMLNVTHDALQNETSPKLQKFKKILALANKSKTYSEEAEVAMTKANEMMVKYNLERLLHENQDKTAFCTEVIALKRRVVQPYQTELVMLLQDNFFVKPIFSKMYSPEEDKYLRSVNLVGTTENAAVAKYVFEFLSTQMESLWKQFYKDNKHLWSPDLPTPNKRSFRLGVIEGFSEKLKKSKEKLVSQQPEEQQEAFENALITTEDAELMNYVAKRYPSLSSRTSYSSTSNSSSREAGHSAGSSLTLNRAMSSSSSSSSKLKLR